MKASRIRSSLTIMSVSFACACASSVDGMAGDGVEFGEGASPEAAASYDDGASSDLEAESESDVEAVAHAESERSEASEDGVALGKLEQELGGSCGSKSNPVNSVFYYTTVPDHFPPDSAVALLAATAIGVPLSGLAACVPFGVANMHSTCDAHDACYATPGKSKSECDRAARSGWERACKRTYDSIDTTDVVVGILTGGVSAPVSLAEQACRESCVGMAQAMYLAISAAGQSAYDAAQRDASRPTIDRVPQGPIFF
jgi:hypothetical protein